MSYNRLVTLCAGVLGIGWVLALAVNLIFWFPQVSKMDPGFWDDSRLFLQFAHENAITWRVFHIGATTGLVGLVALIPLLATLYQDDDRWLGMTAVGLVGAVFFLLASLIDHLGTPVLARYSVGGSQIARQIWEFMEPWRDAGLKTIAYWLLGVWSLWIGGRWLPGETRRLGRFSQVMGVAFLLLAFIETMIPPPLLYTVGETGVGSVAFLLLPIWALWVARWFWRRELAGVRG